MAMTVTLDWLGVSTFRLVIDDLVIFLDAYINRVSTAPDVGLKVEDVAKSDYVLVGHSHFDHLWGAETIAHNTGATIIGSHETVRLMQIEEVHEDQLISVSGGEQIRLSESVTIKVFPSQHSCIWSQAGASEDVCLGDRDIMFHQRQERLKDRAIQRSNSDEPGMSDVLAHRQACNQFPRQEGGAYAYLIETPEGSIFWKDTSGHWTGILRDLRPDVAILAASGRGNVDGEPVQGSLAQFIAREADLLRPKKIVLCHHDDWNPPVTKLTDVGPIRDELERQSPKTSLVEMGYLEEYPIFK
jgi:L-ascorbate metabolism protein UlaG (beta-lactamase superfamily)